MQNLIAGTSRGSVAPISFGRQDWRRLSGVQHFGSVHPLLDRRCTSRPRLVFHDFHGGSNLTFLGQVFLVLRRASQSVQLRPGAGGRGKSVCLSKVLEALLVQCLS